MEREACPQKVIDRASILYHNGVTGFQAPHGGGKDLFVLCLLNIDWGETSTFERTILPSIRKECCCNSLEMGDYIGRDYLSIHWSEYNQRFKVLSTLLQHRIPFQAATKTLPGFGGKGEDIGTTEFTQELLESRIMEQTKLLVNIGLIGMVSQGCYYDWNWSTLEGKEFANELRKKYGNNHKSQYDEETTNFYQWEIFESYDPFTLCDLIPTTVVIVDEVGMTTQEEVCMICLDNEADTMVLPCEHCVVCKECSLRLEHTNNNWLCIKCRQVITHKLV